MINFNNLNQEIPYLVFKEKYDAALNAGQKSIEAIVISSFNNKKKEVDSRFVNLKVLENNKFIFFSNYNSPKSIAFKTHNQIAGLFYWPSINAQIKMKAKIEKTSLKYNHDYFEKRLPEKNALAISSNQSMPINSYEDIEKKYKKSLQLNNLKQCPDYWGGYSFTPYYFEFWEGHDSRLNKRDIYIRDGVNWIHSILEP